MAFGADLSLSAIRPPAFPAELYSVSPAAGTFFQHLPVPGNLRPSRLAVDVGFSSGIRFSFAGWQRWQRYLPNGVWFGCNRFCLSRLEEPASLGCLAFGVIGRAFDWREGEQPSFAAALGDSDRAAFSSRSPKRYWHGRDCGSGPSGFVLTHRHSQHPL